MAAPKNQAPDDPSPPTTLARLYARYVVGFGVGVAVAMAPFLGSIGVPLFTPLASLLPHYERGTATAVAGLVGGLGAMILEFYSMERQSGRRLRRLFPALLVVLLVMLGVLLLLNSLFVLVLPIQGGQQEVSILISGARTAQCPCPGTMSDLQCLQSMGLAKTAIEECWGLRQLRLLRFAYVAAYGAVIGLFGLLVATLILRRRQHGSTPTQVDRTPTPSGKSRPGGQRSRK